MSQLQDLRARMRLDNAQFSRGLKQAKSETQTFGRQLLGVVRSFAGPLASAFSFGAIAAGARRGANEIDEVAKSARAIEGSIGGVRAAELAMSEAGVSASVFRQEMQNLNREVASGKAETSMRALGIETREFVRLDADEKVALIADRVKELGLDAGSTNAILRDFGIRNRDMALLMMQGGDAIRGARRDIEDYGLALSSVDSAKIEEANDRIGRLTVIGQYLRQELALAVTPALGEFAQMMTESMREGGALRAVIDGLVGVIPRLSTYVATAAAGAAVYGTALAGIAAAKWLVVGAAAGLRAALMRLGLPILILAAGEMVFQFTQLVKATGGWGEALDLLKQVAEGVWNGISTSAKAIVPALQAVWNDIKAGFFGMLSGLTDLWATFLRGIANGLRDIPGMDAAFERVGVAAISAGSAVHQFNMEASTAASRADQLRSQASQLAREGFGAAASALSQLRQVMAKADEDGAEYGGTLREIYQTLEDIGGSGGGGGAAGRAAGGVKDVADKTKEAARAQEQWAQSVAGHFDGLITGGKDFSGVLSSIARQLESSGWKMLFQGLGGGGGGFFGGIGKFFGFFDGGGYIPSGGWGVAAEKRDEFVNGVLVRGPANITGGAETARMMQGGGKMDVRVYVDQDGNWQAAVARISGNIAAQTVQRQTPQMISSAFAGAREDGTI